MPSGWGKGKLLNFHYLLLLYCFRGLPFPGLGSDINGAKASIDCEMPLLFFFLSFFFLRRPTDWVLGWVMRPLTQP